MTPTSASIWPQPVRIDKNNMMTSSILTFFFFFYSQHRKVNAYQESTAAAAITLAFPNGGSVTAVRTVAKAMTNSPAASARTKSLSKHSVSLLDLNLRLHRKRITYITRSRSFEKVRNGEPLRPAALALRWLQRLCWRLWWARLPDQSRCDERS
jgi:hypothetical protein